MAGRCAECGTYHYDGPPCDNCGEMGFTEAPKVMECAECGEVHLDGNPPCNACGEMGFRRVANPDQHLGDGGPADEEPDWASLGGSGNRRTFLYGLGLVGVLGAGYYAYSSSNDYPTKEAPGEADEAAGITFATAEKATVDAINERRQSESAEPLSRKENVDAFAEYWNKTRVDEVTAVDPTEFRGDFNVKAYHGFYSRLSLDGGRRIETFESASGLGREMFENLTSDEKAPNEMTKYEWTKIGLDVHAGPEGDVFYVVVFA